MSSELDEIEGLLGIPGTSLSYVPLPDANTFNQQTCSLGNQFGLTDNEYVTKSIERMIETKFSNIEERLIQVVKSEGENFRKIVSENVNKVDHLIHLLTESINGHNLLGVGDVFELSMDKDMFPKVDSVFSGDSSIQTNASFFNKREIAKERLV